MPTFFWLLTAQAPAMDQAWISAESMQGGLACLGSLQRHLGQRWVCEAGTPEP